MDTKTYTMDSVLIEFGEDNDFGQEYRKMNEAVKKKAVEKLNLGATKGIKNVVKEKVLTTKYSSLCSDKLKAHLISTRVDVQNMFCLAPPPSNVMHDSCCSCISWRLGTSRRRSINWLEF
jgi:hypothetical protein